MVEPHCCKHLVPRLCLGTHGVVGSAGWKRGRTLRAVGYEAGPRNQVLGVFFSNLKMFTAVMVEPPSEFDRFNGSDTQVGAPAPRILGYDVSPPRVLTEEWQSRCLEAALTKSLMVATLEVRQRR